MNYIGICGYANSGKDFLCEVLSSKYSIARVSLADTLKREVREDCISKFGIDPVTCSREQKNQIRDYLVSYGKKKRLESDGRYFTEAADKYISKNDFSAYDFIIVPDIRYACYFDDEAQWLKSKNGILLNVQRNGVFAPNWEELTNLPAVVRRSDFTIAWPEFKTEKIKNSLDFLDSISIIKALDGRLSTSRNGQKRR